MKPARALAVFTVGLRGRKLRVRVVPTEADVDAECRRYEGRRAASSRMMTNAYFQPPRFNWKSAGTIVLPANGRLTELVPHEVVHAVLYRAGGVHTSSDETFATDVGRICARILRQIARRGIEVAP